MEKKEVKKIENITQVELEKLNKQIFRDTKDDDLPVEIEEDTKGITK